MGFANHRGSELGRLVQYAGDNNDNIVIANKTNSNNKMTLMSECVKMNEPNLLLWGYFHNLPNR